MSNFSRLIRLQITKDIKMYVKFCMEKCRKQKKDFKRRNIFKIIKGLDMKTYTVLDDTF